jgi:hypothetical protein
VDCHAGDHETHAGNLGRGGNLEEVIDSFAIHGQTTCSIATGSDRPAMTAVTSTRAPTPVAGLESRQSVSM